jgi:hypothetical protein
MGPEWIGFVTAVIAAIIAAALERILSNVQRPARYTGREWNSIVKDWD